MPGTSGSISGANFTIAVKTGAAAYTDISGSVNQVRVEGGLREVQGFHTFGADAPLLTIGKRGPIMVYITAAYTETATEACIMLQTYFEGKSLVSLRMRPRGDTAGYWQFIGDGYIQSFAMPGEVICSGGKAQLVQFIWFGSDLPKTTQ